MDITRKRRFTDIARGFFLLGHPGPVLFHVLGVTLFAVLAGWPHIAWGVLLLVVAAHTAMQLSIAVINDYCDRYRDGQGKKRKPIPLGLVRPREALVYGWLLMGVMLLLLLPLNLFALLVSLFYLAFGQAYNLGLKSTPLSGVVFALAIPLIPLYAFAGMGHVVPLIFWLVPVAALLGVVLNLANSLPDLEEDAASGARTLAVVLGVRRSFLLIPVLMGICLLFVGLLAWTATVPARSAILLPTLALTLLLLLGAMLFFGATKPISTRKRYFYLVMLTCLILAGGWIIGVLF